MTGPDPGTAPDERPASAAGRAPGETPHLDESVRRVRAAGKETLDSGLDSLRALRKLASADFALARSALGRAIAWCAIAVVFGASAWLLAMAAAVALLQAWGLSWLAAIAIPTLLSVVATGVAAWRVSVFFDYAGMHATRRQLARLGLFSENDDEEDEGSVPAPSADAAAASAASDRR
ncbi:phage holin family protein [Luteimonas sp. BDR2-5]|uniref:phage holin family protein n=1 Tax=Proluteimonas luteida TaxID=2878685 RepID=UPI001E562633|nr:phage holin family protein [Luteimonas sp. BDR2-5]MCD9027158.1 phage holin family protein [Luteimonas sp. BDR2-5]